MIVFVVRTTIVLGTVSAKAGKCVQVGSVRPVVRVLSCGVMVDVLIRSRTISIVVLSHPIASQRLNADRVSIVTVGSA